MTDFNKQEDLRDESVKRKYSSIIKLAKNTALKYDELEDNLSCFTNLVDILNINENKHSIILKKILNNKKGNEYRFVPSFLKQVLKKEIIFNYEEIKIKTEKNRVDISIEDGFYAIIIESKVYNAPDQKLQLERYVGRFISDGYQEENIFVLYLTGHKKESYRPDSLGKYKESNNIYFQLSSFEIEILTWLEKDVYPQINENNKVFDSFVYQYKNSLESEFLNKYGKEKDKMNDQINDYILNEINVFENKIDDGVDEIKKVINDTESLRKNLSRLLTREIERAFILWGNKIKNDYSHLDFSDDNCEKNEKYVGVLINYNENKFSVAIEKDSSNIYIGVKVHSYKDPGLKEEITKLLSNVFDNSYKIGVDYWYGWKYIDNYGQVYSNFELLLNKINQEIETLSEHKK
ncbi:PD-(D/E)XK nuclease family protein [Proteus sp. ZN5]|uniref:PD-(D/E)XK nuclease family protein n=1 Tax=Proteus sp. ZN5 TaxID=2697019 RepID=UPI0013E0FC5F|nr:PD-(D/E)XK nuclease family protein [Proteus sp. ZN5]QIG05047.1 hypothetical protein GTK47_06740 [Proteus sp. ZN5]